MSTRKFTMGLHLAAPETKEAIPVTMHFEMDGEKLVSVHGLGDEGEEYTLSFVIRKKDGGDGCWICDEPPCPPNKPNWYNPCRLPE